MGDETLITRKMIDALLNVEEGLTDWEVGFVVSINQQFDQSFSLSEKQMKILEDLHRKHCE